MKLSPDLAWLELVHHGDGFLHHGGRDEDLVLHLTLVPGGKPHYGTPVVIDLENWEYLG